MASVGDVTILALRLQQLAQELHSEATGARANLARLAELSDKVAEFADHVAVTFGELNASLERCPVLEEARATAEAVATGLAAESERVAVDERGAEPEIAASSSDDGDVNGAGFTRTDPGRIRAFTALLPRRFAPARVESNGHAVPEPKGVPEPTAH
jgi:hypothetical protein